MNYGVSLQFVNIDTRVNHASIVGALVVCVYFCVVLHRMTGVSCTFGPDCIGILCFASTGVVFGLDCIGILRFV